MERGVAKAESQIFCETAEMFNVDSSKYSDAYYNSLP